MSDRSPSAERANQARGAGRVRPGNKASVPPARPKMGVRAKTSDWLLRRDDGENSHPKQSEQGGKDPQNCNRPAPRLSLDGILGAPPPQALHLPIQRSNSDVTISDIAPEDITSQNTPNSHTGTSLHRGYGSTSSLDQQEVQSATVSGGPPGPSLQTATLIARGEIAGIAADANDLEKGPSQRRRTDSSPETTFLFRKLLTGARSEQEGAGLPERRPHGLRKTFAHYDVQSVLFHMNLVLTKRLGLAASKTSSTEPPSNPASPGPRKSISSGDDVGEGYPEPDEGDGQINELLLSCPGFRNELGGEGQRGPWLGGEVEGRPWLSRAGEGTGLSHCTLLEAPRESPALHRERAIRYAIEHLDPGARYYHQHFCGREHQNYFGVDENLGPVVLSIRREKLEDRRSKEGTQYAYRIAFRTSEPWSLRGAVLEDSVPSSARPGSARGLPLKDVLEEVLPELNSQCLHLAPPPPTSPRVCCSSTSRG
ncbi:hypothetical protein GJAV_G00241460 [Gymnothorax javanicus]|nr:hypothetical protein GJAV_G00241460 [Gymnothorax javanicus]